MNSALFILGREIKAETNNFYAHERIRDLIKPTQRAKLESTYFPYFLYEIVLFHLIRFHVTLYQRSAK